MVVCVGTDDYTVGHGSSPFKKSAGNFLTDLQGFSPEKNPGFKYGNYTAH